MNVTVLVDFENNSVETALAVARALGDRLWGVRLDTSENLVDFSLVAEMGDFKPAGVNERLVRKVRDALDGDGFERVKIVASGGFTVEKIREFERLGVPVDAYGVGSSLIRGANDFTGDVVLTDGRARSAADGSSRHVSTATESRSSSARAASPAYCRTITSRTERARPWPRTRRRVLATRGRGGSPLPREPPWQAPSSHDGVTVLPSCRRCS